MPFMLGWDTGINLHGDLMKGIVKYDVGIFGGAGQNTKNKTNENAYNVRLAVNPLGDMKYGEGDLEYSTKPLVSVGTSYYMNTVSTLKTTTYTDTTKTTTYGTIDNNNSSFASSTGWLGMASQKQLFQHNRGRRYQSGHF